MSDKKKAALSVEEMIEELGKNPSSRFSKSDFNALVFAVLSDRDFNAKKYLIRNGAIVEQGENYASHLYRFLDRLLKHAGMSDSSERQKVLDTFEYGVRDIEWVADAVDEAMSIYTESGKNMRIFRDKMLQLTVKKMVRSGKYDGKATYKKMVTDRTAMIAKMKK